jgi:capsular exopolysaccharide synthesis family protein
MRELVDLNNNRSREQRPAPLSEPQPPSAEVYGNMPEFETSAGLRDYLDVIYRLKWTILAFIAFALVSTLLITLTLKPVYRAEGRIEFNMQAPKVTKFEDVVGSQLQTKEFIQTQVQLLKSTSLAQRVIEKLQFDKALAGVGNGDQEQNRPGMFRRVRAMISRWIPGGDKSKDERIDPGRQQLIVKNQTEAVFSKMLEVQPQRDTTIIKVAFSFTDPVVTRDAVNGLIQEFINWRMDNKVDAASTAKQQLAKQIQLARVQLEKSESALNKFARNAGIVSLEPSLNAVYKQLEQTNKTLAEVRTKRIQKEAAYQQTLDGKVSSLPQVIDSKLIQELRRSYIELYGQYKESATTFKDDFPKQNNVKTKMQEVLNKISEEEARIAESIKNDYFIALKEEQALTTDEEKEKALAMDLNDQATQYKILEREVGTNKQIHQSLLERFKEIDATVGTDMTNIRVVDYANLPLFPFKPNLRLNLLLAAVVGLIGGIGLAFVREYMDNTVKRLDEISDRFRIPLLGVLPLVSVEEAKELDLLVSLHPKASYSEAVRTTKVSIQLSSTMNMPPRKLLFTSTCPGEGKSTTTCNIAQAFAASEEKVILIDCDLRKPRVHKIFRVQGKGGASMGLSQCLSGICDPDDAIVRSGIPNLDFIVAGPIPPNPAELLASNRMKHLLSYLSQRYDRILLDCPPAAGFADVLVLGNQVDGVVLVSTLGKTHREGLRILRRSIHNVQGLLLGCIVNKFNVSYAYGNHYQYYSYSYSEYGDKVRELPTHVKAS